MKKHQIFVLMQEYEFNLSMALIYHNSKTCLNKHILTQESDMKWHFNPGQFAVFMSICWKKQYLIMNQNTKTTKLVSIVSATFGLLLIRMFSYFDLSIMNCN